VNRTNQSEFLNGKQRFTATPTAVADKVHVSANILAKLNQIVGIGDAEEIETFRTFNGSRMAMPD
jgi:hypothetical protein